MIRQIPIWDKIKSTKFVKDGFNQLIKNHKLFKSIIPRSLKDQSSNLLKVWSRQCECVLAHRLRRGQQMVNLYTKLWDEQALKQFLRRLRHQILGKRFICSTIGFASYNWNVNKITDEEIHKYSNEMLYVRKLKDATICNDCSKNCNSLICNCEHRDCKKVESFDGWSIFIEKPDLIVWRKPLHSGLYQYKVYGVYNDVSAQDFLNVQVDTDYRKKWDKTAVALKVVEVDPNGQNNSDVIYWEMQWPRFFTNRDYVFLRRFTVDQKSKTLFLISKSTTHPSCPDIESKFRVTEYWSAMVIKPRTDIDKLGIEFSLTYFDNPGLNVPSSVQTWVTMSALPDFLERLREATKTYQSYCKEYGKVGVFTLSYSRDDEIKQHFYNYFDEDLVTDNTIFEAQTNIKTPSDEERPKTPGDDSRRISLTSNSKDLGNDIVSSVENQKKENKSYWKYFQPTYYFS